MKAFMLPDPVGEVLQAAERAGYEAWVVGGAVRDWLLKREPHDFDLAVSAAPEELKNIYAGWRVMETGLRHGTLTVAARGGAVVEVTSFRSDGVYSDGRHPVQAAFHVSIEADLARRDFTIGAMAWHPERGLLDPYGGREDVKKGLIRCVGRPEERFLEDGLRLLRALRFASELSFALERGTEAALLAGAPRLRLLSAERCRAELCRMLKGAAAPATLARYWPVLRARWPMLPEREATRAAKALAALPADRRDFLGVAALAVLCQERGEAFLRSLRLSSAETARAEGIRGFLQDGARSPDAFLRLACRAGVEEARDAAAVQRALFPDEGDPAEMVDRAAAAGRCLSLRDLRVSGRDLAAAGVSIGPEIGRIKEELLFEAASGQVENETAALLQRAASWIRQGEI